MMDAMTFDADDHHGLTAEQRARRWAVSFLRSKAPLVSPAFVGALLFLARAHRFTFEVAATFLWYVHATT